MITKPTKLTKKFLKIAEEVINENINALIFTDEELIDLINERLPEKKRISKITWKRWKKRKLKGRKSLLDRFDTLYKKAFEKQKQSLFLKLQTDDKAWQRWAWIIERKFPEWNLRQKVDANVKGIVAKIVSYDQSLNQNQETAKINQNTKIEQK